jgi:hypothetical protein
VTLYIPSTSVEYVRCLVTADVALGSQVVSLAFMSPDTEPTSGDWHVGAWDGNYAELLIGPGQAVTMAAHSTYQVWVKIEAPPATIIRRAGPIATY